MRDGSSIVTLRATRRVWAVGAIHGEAARPGLSREGVELVVIVG